VEQAREHSLYLHAGSSFESISGSDRVYNTSGVIGPNGTLLDTSRDVLSRLTTRESTKWIFILSAIIT
jgi:hypothetical protein